MAESLRFQSGARRRRITQKRKKLKCNQLKAGKRKQNKGLSLDPQRNQHHYHHQNQNQGSSLRHVGEVGKEEGEENQEPSENEPQLYHHPQQQAFLHHHQLLYGRLDSSQQLLQPPQQQAQPQPQPSPKKRSYLPSSSSLGQNVEHASLRGKMGETSRLGLRNTVGQIVQVQGGHIVRSTGRKDRHSKVCTAKGPRDRRVRLSAHTAIQFYDVQDRLGYDRPSKAVDWLIKKAKPAIDELAELPAWKPTIGSASAAAATNTNLEQEQAQKQQEDNNFAALQQGNASLFDNVAGPSSKRAMGSNTASFLPPSLESDAIADTIKSFFPMGSSTSANSSAMQFHSFQEPHLLSRTNSQNQDLSLSLQFQDPILLHHQNQQAQHHNQREQEQVQVQAPAHFTGNTPLGFDTSGWSMHQRLSSWSDSRDNAHGGSSGGAVTGAGGYLFNSPPAPVLLQQLFGQNQFFSQRGPLQSSNTSSIRAMMDPSAIAIASGDPSHHHQAVLPMYPSTIPGYGFASEVGGFSGFRIPARIQGEEEEHDGISDKPSSASSDSRH